MKKTITILMMGLLLISLNAFAQNDVFIDSDGNVQTGVSASSNLYVTGASGEHGILGSTSGTGAAGVYGINTTNGNYGILGYDTIGVYGSGYNGGWAGYFDGNTYIRGDLTVDGTLIGFAETDPKIGTLINGNWCVSDGTLVNCNQSPPLLIETDPTVAASVKDGVDWTELSGIPLGFADGVDNTGDLWTLSGSDIYYSAGNVGIGTAIPDGELEVAADQQSSNLYATGYRNTLSPGGVFIGRKARGSMALPGAVQPDDVLAGFGGSGYGSTGWSSPRASMHVLAAESWTDSAQGTHITFQTTPTGFTTRSERIRITSEGNVGIGTTAPNEQLEITGNLRLPTTTATTGIIKSGGNTLMHTYGTYNFFAGTNAGNLSMTGSYNTGVGAWALAANTTGYHNAAFGSNALDANTVGYQNTAIGYYALSSNTTSSKNTAIGKSALISQSFDNGGIAYESNNTAVGFEALYSNQPTATYNGDTNTAVGSRTLRQNTTGSGNTAIGNNALYANTTGNGNTAIGNSALDANTTGYGNIATGFYALSSNTTGNSNVASGNYALSSNTAGNSNVASGEFALYANKTANGNTAVGSSALRNQSYDNGGTAYDSYNTAVGFEALYSNQSYGTYFGRNNTAVGSLVMRDNFSGYENTAVGNYALQTNYAGYHNTAVGNYALQTNSYGYKNTAIGYEADVSTGSLFNATAIGYGAVVNGSNKVVIGNTSVGSIGGYAAWSNFSDRRVKTDIKGIKRGLDFIEHLRPVSFKMKNGNGNTDFGFVAQDIEALLGDNYNLLDIGGGKERMLSLRYTQFIAPMVKAIQQQQEIIDSQQEQINELKKIVEELRKRI